MSKLDNLFRKLDLTEHIKSLQSFFARAQDIAIMGDQNLHFRYIESLDKLEFKAPPKIEFYESYINHLKKQGVLRFVDIFEILKSIRYFRALKNSGYEGLIGEWMDKIIIPEIFSEIDRFFGEDGVFIESNDEQVYGLSQREKAIKSDINESLRRLLHTQKLSSYLVDTQIHYINDEETLLVRGGFNHVLKASIISRSSSGFFYVVPDVIMKYKEQLRHIAQEKEHILYEYAKKFSSQLATTVPFLSFIDKEFSRFDHYQARVLFARFNDLSIVKSNNDNIIKLSEFAHPALSNPKPVDIDFSKNILMITGVNAGGKTMLLKSILSSVVMAKYLIPMRINRHNSHIGHFKFVESIIDDPQSVKNDISTFAGRIVQFSELFNRSDALIGVDEIELGTDSDEAAALFAVMLDELVKKNQKIIITTHHKRLAALMADRDDVELLAALYDEERREPTYQFLRGIIGKSYAFETAIRYGIREHLVDRAKNRYSQDSEKLNVLIERGSELERELKQKNIELDERLEALKKEEARLKELRQNLQSEIDSEKAKLHHRYSEAINEAKSAAREADLAAIHRKLNSAKNKLPRENKEIVQHSEPIVFEVGQNVKYRKQRGTIVALSKNDATIEIEGMKLRVKLNELKPSGNLPKKIQSKATTQIEQKGGLTLDLHGLRGEEACERCDKFISDALIQGFDEVLIYHGIGTGKLSYAIKEFLKAHPSVKSFSDAPAHMGGFGAKVVKL